MEIYMESHIASTDNIGLDCREFFRMDYEPKTVSSYVLKVKRPLWFEFKGFIVIYKPKKSVSVSVSGEVRTGLGVKPR